uniref:hypothetical protein n=1 Tax=Brevibacterium sp. Ap13 TaxID=1406197 RepID=UPI0015639248|nr:hypothetical protein [Brevibacterium sp. Ap13]
MTVNPWSWKQWTALGVFVVLVGVLIFNGIRNRDETRAAQEVEETPSATATPSEEPELDPDEIDRLTEEQGESGEPESGPGDLPVDEPWFKTWKQAAEQLAIAFVDTSGGQEEWTDTMSEMMTDRLAESYESVDIRNVPQGTYQSVELDEQASTADAVWVTITYDTFTMKVRLRHHNERWLAEEIEPV